MQRDSSDNNWCDDSSEASSDQTDDDDGHGDCGKGGFHSCPDNPDNIYLQEGEDGSVTARYVEWNLMSETESSGFSHSASEGDSPSLEEEEEPDPEESWDMFRAGETRKMTDTRLRHRRWPMRDIRNGNGPLNRRNYRPHIPSQAQEIPRRSYTKSSNHYHREETKTGKCQY